uniref:Uncharacterized protein n=1 Tax=Hanusia phi TaxID=3032 RepID=A0A7S0HAI3_9CRYP
MSFSLSMTPFLPAARQRLGNLRRSKSGEVNALMMKLDVAPQVIQQFPTAQEQNECLGVVNRAIAELNKNSKSTQEMGRADGVTYILAGGRPQKGVISVRFNCKFKKGSTAMQPGFMAKSMPFFGPSTEEGEGRGFQVAQVSCQATPTDIIQLSIDVDGGWGRRLAIIGR